jgi:hypothetical protein
MVRRTTIGELQDELKHRARRIEELRREIDEQRDLIKRQQEQIDDYDALMEQWATAFRMEQNADGEWSWAPFIEAVKEVRQQRDKLLRDWNRFVDEYNAVVVPRRRNVGRPIAASDAQQDEVRKLRKGGHSLRAIAEETSLGLQTVVTILSKDERTDRASRKHLQRIDPDRAAALRWKAQARAINGIPGTVNRLLKTSRALHKEAKGLGR